MKDKVKFRILAILCLAFSISAIYEWIYHIWTGDLIEYYQQYFEWQWEPDTTKEMRMRKIARRSCCTAPILGVFGGIFLWMSTWKEDDEDKLEIWEHQQAKREGKTIEQWREDRKERTNK